MKFIYPAVFKKKTDGGYAAYFPDLEFCEASGETLDDAIDNANEAARTWITVELEEDEPILPHVSDPEDILLAEDELIRNISVNIRFLRRLGRITFHSTKEPFLLSHYRNDTRKRREQQSQSAVPVFLFLWKATFL